MANDIELAFDSNVYGIFRSNNKKKNIHWEATLRQAFIARFGKQLLCDITLNGILTPNCPSSCGQSSNLGMVMTRQLAKQRRLFHSSFQCWSTMHFLNVKWKQWDQKLYKCINDPISWKLDRMHPKMLASISCGQKVTPIHIESLEGDPCRDARMTELMKRNETNRTTPTRTRTVNHILIIESLALNDHKQHGAVDVLVIANYFIVIFFFVPMVHSSCPGYWNKICLSTLLRWLSLFIPSSVWGCREQCVVLGRFCAWWANDTQMGTRILE